MSKDKRILVTGANGQLGQEIQRVSAAYPRYEFEFLTREMLSIDNDAQIRDKFKKFQPAFCINCAAYTAVDKAETDKDAAHNINAKAVSLLAIASKQHGARFIHVSTDYVFDGNATQPYKVNAPVNPQGVYGATKLEGEKLALSSNPESIIIRTSWVYSEFGKNFVKTMMRLMKEKESLNVVNDQSGSPTYAFDLAEAILEIISSGKWKAGIYQYSNTGIITWYEFAVAIRELINARCTVNPIPTSGYPTPAKRPAYSAMDTSLITNTFDIKLKPWKERLSACIDRLNATVS
jgi:dTDP-4-dehydrorhamnose reductase